MNDWLTVQELVEAFKALGGEADWSNIQNHIATTRHHSTEPYKDKRNYDNTLRQLLHCHCRRRPGVPDFAKYSGNALFQEVGPSRYKLLDFNPLVPCLPLPSVENWMKTSLEQFRQIIVYGPPGTGKSREAKRVALAMLSGKNPEENSTDDDIEMNLKPFRDQHRYDLVVFHPAYEYEQFVGGIEPTMTEGKQLAFQPKAGTFLRLCRKAKEHHELAVLIIDEINRGNLPKLLGELVYALEYRDHEVTLPFEYEGSRTLRIPKNLYIIATMNSADRSIGHIDVAIRRRFGLLHMGPNSEVVREIWRSIDEPYGRHLAGILERLNKALNNTNDPSAEAELGVGHSYFLPLPDSSGKAAKEQVARKWKHQVQPLLREYAQLLNLDANLIRMYLSPLEDVLAQL